MSRSFEFRRVGCGTNATRLGRTLGPLCIVGALGEREDSPPGGSEFVVLTEPRL